MVGHKATWAAGASPHISSAHRLRHSVRQALKVKKDFGVSNAFFRNDPAPWWLIFVGLDLKVGPIFVCAIIATTAQARP
jgi:hypothetical protein